MPPVSSTARRAVLVAGTLLAAACGGDGTGPTPPSPAPVAVVVFAQTVDTVEVGASQRVSAEPRDAAGHPLPDRAVAYVSSNPDVVAATGDGQLTALKVGSATITATSEGKSGTLTVLAAPRVTVGRDLPSLFAGDTTQLVVTSLTDAAGRPLTGGADTAWATSDPAVATVSSSGVVTGRAAGTATISAAVSGGRGSQQVVVLAPVVRANRDLAYIRHTDDSRGNPIDELRLLRGDGGGSTRFSTADDFVREYAWAPDGSSIAIDYVMSNGSTKNGLYVARVDGTGEQRIGAMDAITWSPDGTRLLGVEWVSNSEAAVYSVGATGADRRQVTDLTGLELEPRWSPDGRRVVFIHTPDVFAGAYGELWVAAADGSNARRVVTGVPAAHPRWSPDGKRIAFDNGLGIFVVDLDGSGATRSLTANCTGTSCTRSGVYLYPSWSPDGRRLAYAGSADPSSFDSQIYVAALDGTVLTTVQAGTSGLSWPQWSPDGRMLAYTGTQPYPGWPSIYVVPATGGTATLLSGAENAGTATWQP